MLIRWCIAGLLALVAVMAQSGASWAVCTVGSKTLTITPSTVYYPFAGGTPSITFTYTVNYTNIVSGGAGPDCTVNLTVPVTRVNVGGTFSAAVCTIPFNIPNPSNGINRSGSCNITWTAPATPNALYSHDANSDPAATVFDINAALVTNVPVYRRPRITVANNTNGSETGPTAGALTVSQSNIIGEPTTVNLNYAGTATSGTDYTGPTSVTIPAGSLSAPVALNVTDDTIVEVSESVDVTLSTVTAGGGTIFTPSSATNAITDNDTAEATIANTTDGSENGPTDGEMTVTLSNSVATDTELTYTVAGTATAGDDYTALSGTVTVPALATTVSIPIQITDDFIDDDDETVIVTLAGTNNTKVTIGSTPSATNTIVNDDVASVAIAGAPISLPEFGATETLLVALTSQPTSDVTVTITGVDATEHTLSATTLIFTPDDWDFQQAVDVSSVDDFVQDGDVTVTLSFEPTGGGYDGVDPGTADVTTVDDDEAGVFASEDPINISESGTTGVIDVVLRTQPLANVIITLAASDSTEASVSPTTLTFTPANWNVSQQATITGVDDLLTDGEIQSSVSLTSSSTDPVYNAVAIPGPSVFTADDDTAGIRVTGGPVTVSEAGTSRSVTVVLTSAPSSNVVLAATLSDATEARSNTASITFTPANWNVPQTVTITGVDDSDVDGKITSQLTFAVVPDSSDDAFDALTPQNVTITTLDDDVSLTNNDEQVRRAFKAQTHNYLTSRMRMLASNRPQIFRMIERDQGRLQIDGDGQSIKGDFALSSAVLDRMTNVTPVADIPLPRSSRDVNIWAEGRFAVFDSDADDAKDNFFVGYAGMDLRIYETLALGIMAQMDWAEEKINLGKTDGTGWMIGPYLTAELSPNLFIDARALWGRSENDARQTVAGESFIGAFETERVLVEARVSGSHQIDQTTLRPDITVFWLNENQDDYAVISGARNIAVDGISTSLGQLSAGLNLSHLVERDTVAIQPFIEPRLIWTFDDPGRMSLDGNVSNADDMSASITLGLTLASPSTEMTFDASYETLINGDGDSWAGSVQFLHRF
jgi:hypothetical protein